MQIATALEKYLVSSNTHEPSSKERRFYLSDMGKCPRVRWLKRHGVDTEFEPFVNWIFKMGDLIHDFGYKALESQGLLISAEETVETEHFVGRYDGMIKGADGKKKLFDFKSAGSYKMKKILAGEDDEENISQILSYVMFEKEKGDKDLSDTGSIIYINKEPNDQVPIVFFEKEYHLTDWRAKQIKEEMDKMIKYWEDDEIPRCSCPSWMKPYNSYQPLCQANDKDIRKYLSMVEEGKKLVSTKKILYLVDGEKRKELVTL